MAPDDLFSKRSGFPNPDDESGAGSDDDHHRLLEESLDETLADILEEPDQPRSGGKAPPGPSSRPAVPPPSQPAYRPGALSPGYSAASRAKLPPGPPESPPENAREDGEEEFSELFGGEDFVKEIDTPVKGAPSAAPEVPITRYEQKDREKAKKVKGIAFLAGAIVTVIVIIVAVVAVMSWNAKKDMKTIIFSLEPRDAEIFSSDRKLDFKVRKDGKMELRDLLPGAYTLIFRKQGYLQTERKDVEVQENKVTELGAITLTRLPANTLIMDVKPDNPDIMVYVNGELKKWKKADDGRLMVSDLTPGTVSVRIECKDCETWKKDGISVSKESCTELEPVALAEKAWRSVDIEVFPVNAEVYINGKKIPTALNARNVLVTDPLEPGFYRILIFAEGYESWNRKDAEIFNDISTSIGPLKLPKLQGGKIIIEAPEKSEFYIDDQKAVATIRSDKRAEINNVKPGAHNLKITREGGKDILWEGLDVPADRPVEIAYSSWTDMKGKEISLSTIPGEVTVSLDGTSKGKTSAVPGALLSLSGISAGSHALKFEKEGYESVIIDGIKVTDDMPAIVPAVIMTKIASKMGTITVKGKPDQADVKIEGGSEPQKAPCTLKDIPSGETTLIISKEGFKEKKQKVVLKAGEEKEVTYKLEKGK